MSAKDFIVLSDLGKGSYSSVYKVRRISDGRQYALKKVRLLALKEKEKSNALNEVRLLASITSQYVVSYKEAFLEDSTNSLCIVMEFADGGDLQQKIDKAIKRHTHIEEPEVWKMIKDILNGLKVLHDMKIVHRDIKTANIFISGGLYKLGDLNVSKIVEMGLAYTQTGTPYYASPEVWRDEPYDSKSDIWSLGCVIYEVCTLKPPFQANDMQGLFKKIQAGKFQRIPSRYSQQLQRFIQRCLQMTSSKRPNCEQLLRTPIILGSHTDQSLQHNSLLDTIKIPRNLHYLKGMLPKSKYQQAETETERIPSRRSDLTNGKRPQNSYQYQLRKNGSEKAMFPDSTPIPKSKNVPIKIGKEDYLSYRNKKQQGQGSYVIQGRSRIQSDPRSYIHPHQKLHNVPNPDKIRQQLQAKLMAREKNLLGGLPRYQHTEARHTREMAGNPARLPILEDRRAPTLSMKVNNVNPVYDYNRPSWWG